MVVETDRFLRGVETPGRWDARAVLSQSGNSMNANDAGRENGHDDRIELDDRTERALTEPLSAVSVDGTPLEGDETIVSVVSHSGESYDVDVREGRCSCPDARHREPEGGCKHVRRARVALGRETVDARTLRAVDVDDTLGASAPGPRVATSDGGVVGGDVDTDEPTVREAVEGAEVLDESDGEDGAESDTSAREPRALDDAIAEAAPYVNNRFHNGR